MKLTNSSLAKWSLIEKHENYTSLDQTTIKDLRRQFMQNELLLTKPASTCDSAKRKQFCGAKNMVEIQHTYDKVCNSFLTELQGTKTTASILHARSVVSPRLFNLA